jgi:hypothetical protein
MQVHSPLSDEVIDSALKRFAADAVTSQRLAWWLLGGHSTERWFQFELAYQLDRCFEGRYTTVCEVQWRDIVVFQRPPTTEPIWQNAPVAAAELKWLGNWCVTDKTLAGIKADVAKIDAGNIPSISLVVCLLAEPTDTNSDYNWLRNQVQKGIGVAKAAEIQARLNKLCAARFNLISEVACQPTKEMNRLQLSAYVCRKKVN